MPSLLELMQFHVNAAFTHDAQQRLDKVNEPDGQGGPAPRFFLGRTREGNVWRFRPDVPVSLVERLAGLCADETASESVLREPQHMGHYLQLLAPVQEVSMGPAYLVPVMTPPAETVCVTLENARLLQGGFDWLIPRIDDEQPCFAVVHEGQAVTICRSVRITAQAHEAGLETLAAFRGRGYAARAVLGWAAAVRERGALPLYSTSWENEASLAVARKLGSVQYGVTFHLT